MSGAEIPAAAIEAAARAYRAKVEWIDRHSRDDYGREDELGMRAALEAAAPYLLAQGWEEGNIAANFAPDYVTNPYRSER